MSGPVLWAKLSWHELETLAQRPPHLAIWPIGAIEQHGRHLPTDVDVRNCREVAEGVSAETGVPLLPALAFGDSRFWEGWPGTLTLQPETLVQLMLEISDGVARTGFRRLLLLNGHIGNGPVLAIAEAKIRQRHPSMQVRALGWWDVSPRVVAAIPNSPARQARRALDTDGLALILRRASEWTCCGEPVHTGAFAFAVPATKPQRARRRESRNASWNERDGARSEARRAVADVTALDALTRGAGVE